MAPAVQERHACMGVAARVLFTWAAACVMMTAAGSLFVFNTYAQALKNHIGGATHKTMSYVVLVGNLGLNMGLPVGLAIDRWGARSTLAAGAVLSAAGYLWLYLCLNAQPSQPDGVVPATEVASLTVAQLYPAFAAVGLGSCFAYLPAFMVFKNFRHEYRGVVMGLTEAMFAAAAALMSFLYSYIFSSSSPQEASLTQLRSFFLFLAIAMAAVNVIGIATLRIVSGGVSQTSRRGPEEWAAMFASHPPFQMPSPPSPSNGEAASASTAHLSLSPTTGRFRRAPSTSSGRAIYGGGLTRGQEPNGRTPGRTTHRRTEQAGSSTPMKALALFDDKLIRQNVATVREALPGSPVHSLAQLLRRWDCWFLLVVFTMLNAGFVVFVHDIGSIASAWGRPDAANGMSIAFLVSQSLSAIGIGVLSDLIHRHLSVATLLAFAAAIAAWGYVLVACTDWLLSGAVVLGASMGGTWCLSPQLVAERFGVRRFGTAWGMMMLASGLGPFVLQPLQVAVYELNNPNRHIEHVTTPSDEETGVWLGTAGSASANNTGTGTGVGVDCDTPACFVTTLLGAAGLATVAHVLLVVVGRRFRRPSQLR